MDIKYVTAADGDTIGTRAWTTYGVFNDPARDGEMGLMTFFHRPVAAPNPDLPGTWRAHVETAQIDEEMEWHDAGQVPGAAWKREAPLEGVFPSAKDARLAAFKEVQDRDRNGDLALIGDLDPERALMIEQERSEARSLARNPSFRTGPMMFHSSLGRVAGPATFLDQHGFFYDSMVCEEGFHVGYKEQVRREGLNSGEAVHFDAYAPVPYETGAARPAPEAMAQDLRQRQGNLVRYALDKEISLVDALRDGLISGEMRIEDPIAMAIVNARLNQEANREGPAIAAGSLNLTPTLEAFRECLSDGEAQIGIDARDEHIKLGAIARLSPRTPDDHARMATELYDVLGAARSYGLEPKRPIQDDLAGHALAAVSDRQRAALRVKEAPRALQEAR